MDNTNAEVLISRVVDQVDRPEDWIDLEQLAESDDRVWAQLIETMRAQCHLRVGHEALLSTTEKVELPEQDPQQETVSLPSPAAGGHWRWIASAAAALLLGFFLGSRGGGEALVTEPATFADPMTVAQVDPEAMDELPVEDDYVPTPEKTAIPVSLSDSWNAYVDATQREGLFLEEMVPVVLETRPNPNGEGFEVTFVRGVVQRDIVDSLYEVGVDEHGQPMPLEIQPERYVRQTSL